MPPPPSPKFIQSNYFQPNTDSTFESSSHCTSSFEEKIAPSSPFLSSRPNSSASFSSAGAEENGLIEQLKSRLRASESENNRLRAAGDANVENMSDQLEKLKREVDDVTNNSAVVEGKLHAANLLLASQNDELQVFRRENEEVKQQLTDLTRQARQDGAAQESQIHAQNLEINTLKDNINKLEQMINSKDEINSAQSSSIQELSEKFEKAYRDFQDERKELFVQIDELRTAGQVRCPILT